MHIPGVALVAVSAVFSLREAYPSSSRRRQWEAVDRPLLQPSPPGIEGGNPEEGNFFEGDIILQPWHSTDVRNLVASPRRLWPDGVLPYDFSDEFNYSQRHAVNTALADLQQHTCVRFQLRTTEDTYIHLRNTGHGCASPVGYHPTGFGVDLYLGYPGCQRQGTIQHEFLHALGFWHEHTRPDRDNYVTVIWNNIAPGREFNFRVQPLSEVQYQMMPYDYNSVMHYRSIAFSKNHRSHTIVPRDPGALHHIGQRVRFSNVDVAKLNRLYNCGPFYYRGDDLLTKHISNKFIQAKTLAEQAKQQSLTGMTKNMNITDSTEEKTLITENVSMTKIIAETTDNMSVVEEKNPTGEIAEQTTSGKKSTVREIEETASIVKNIKVIIAETDKKTSTHVNIQDKEQTVQSSEVMSLKDSMKKESDGTGNSMPLFEEIETKITN